VNGEMSFSLPLAATGTTASERSASVLRAYLLETRAEVLRTLRMPSFALPSLLFPAMFYVFFGVIFGNRGMSAQMPTVLLATYGAFGVIGPALFGFGVGVAVERGLGWTRVKRASPMPPGAYFASKIVMSMIFAALVCATLFTLGATVGGVRLERFQWLSLAAWLVFGALPFCAMGLLIGVFAKAQAAPAIVNLLYLPMSFFSGLWIPIQIFPKPLQEAAVFLPPYHLGQLALGTVGFSKTDPVTHMLALLAFTAVFLSLAVWGWKRAEAAA
jgi:ABC-2 type transport system permease protein